MSQQDSKDAGQSRLGHWCRVALMFASFGFIYPNALVEDMDLAKHDADNAARGKARK